MRYDPINPELFITNRKRFILSMEPNSMLICNSNDEMPRNGDQCFPFRQNSDMFGLCGLDQEETVLVLYPDCVKYEMREIAFIKKTNKHIAIWEGHKYSKKEASEVSGIKNIYWLDEMDKILTELIHLCDHIYINSNENDSYRSEVETRDLRFAKYMRNKYPMHSFKRAQPIFKQMAMFKNKYEVELMQHACNITEKAFRRVLKFVKPGIREYDIEAEVSHEFTINQANGHAYAPIIASGKNACVLHYGENNDICKPGDVILFDFGAEYANYAADLSRCIPVSGKFTERQKDVYNAVLRVMKKAITMMVPGTLLNEYNDAVGRIMEKELIGLGLITEEDVKNENPKMPAYKKYFMHGTSHHLGLDVHDLSNRNVPFQAGMILTCEPGIYIPEEDLGIRLEDDILITDNGPVNLMANIPIEVEDVEGVMGR